MSGGFGKLAMLLTVAAVVGAASWWPLGTEVEPLLFEVDLGEKGTVSLSAGKKLRREIEVSSQPISGVAVYTPLTSERGMVVARLEVDGSLVRSSARARQIYRGETMRLEWRWWPITLPAGSVAELTIQRLGGEPLPLQVTAASQTLTVSLLHPVPLTTEARRGVLAGLGVMLAAYLIVSLKRYQWAAAAAVVVLAAPLVLAGFLWPPGVLGISDWDYYFTVHERYRDSFLKYHTFPFWNAYTCGGTAGLADPEFPVLSPLYPLELLFGVSLGLRLAVVISVAWAGLGMLALARRLGLSAAAGVLASLVFSYSSTTLLKLVEGHVDMLAAMWLPWIFWSWLSAYAQGKHRTQTGTDSRQSTEHKAQKHKPAFGIWNLCFGSLKRWQARRAMNNHWPLVCGIFLALTFYQGGLHILVYLVPALLVLSVIVPDKKSGLYVTWQAGWWALGLSAVKLVPVLFWVVQFPDRAYALSTYTVPWLHEIFFGRHGHGGAVIPGQGGGWHEYGAYIGPVVAALAVLSLARWRGSRTVRAVTASTVLAVLFSSLGPVLAPLLDAVPWVPRSFTSRVVLLAVFGAALLGGFGLDVVRRWGRLRLARLSAVLLVGAAAVDLFSLASPLAGQAFILPDVKGSLPPAPAPLAYTRETYTFAVGGVGYDRAYAAARRGYGTLSYCSVLSPQSAVVPVDYPDSEYVRLEDGGGTARLLTWDPNWMAVRASVQRAARLVLNMNYARGWRASGHRVGPHGGRVSVLLQPGEYVVTFRYHAPGFGAGLVLTLATLVLARRTFGQGQAAWLSRTARRLEN